MLEEAVSAADCWILGRPGFPDFPERTEAVEDGKLNIHKDEVRLQFSIFLNGLSSVLSFSDYSISILSKNVFNHHSHECCIIAN